MDYSSLTPIIRNVGPCGACWATTAADLIQAHWYRVHGQSISAVSYQYFLDCDSLGFGTSFTPSDQACSGGSVPTVLEWLSTNAAGGSAPGYIFLETGYPVNYQSNSAQQCIDKSAPLSIFDKRIYALSSWSYAIYPLHSLDTNFDALYQNGQPIGHPDIAPGKAGSPDAGVDREVLLARQLNTWGPLTVLIDATSLQNYMSGILDGASSGCSNGANDGKHAVLVVGLGGSGANQYWIIKNVWGQDWGINGTNSYPHPIK